MPAVAFDSDSFSADACGFTVVGRLMTIYEG